MAIVVAVGVISMINHFSGVDWGDDFALYMRQAKALVNGNIGEVISANRYAVDNSGWSTFSPYAYPWGWPLLIAPLYLVFGLDYEVIKIIEVIALCVFLLAYFAIVRRRTGVVPAIMLMLLIGLSLFYVGSTDSVLSDIPYLALVGVALWWMDRCRERGILEEQVHRLVILGLLLSYTYSTRREGIVLLVALLAIHAAAIVGKALRARSTGVLREVNWRVVAIPYAAFLAATILLQLLLPTVMTPNAPGIGLSNVPHRFEYHREVLAEQVGLKDPGQPIQLLGNTTAGELALTAILVLAAVGLVTRLATRVEEDIGLAAYLLAASFLLLISPYQEGRYLFSVTPFLMYFAYQAFPGAVRFLSSNQRHLRLAAVPPVLAIAGLALVNARDLKHSTDYHRTYHYTVNGPVSPSAVDMFGKVKELTRGDDVILFFRARAMTLYTDRLAIQGSNLDQMLKRSDWYVMAKGSTYSQALLDDDQAAARGLVKAWENGEWVIWRVPPPSA